VSQAGLCRRQLRAGADIRSGRDLASGVNTNTTSFMYQGSHVSRTVLVIEQPTPSSNDAISRWLECDAAFRCERMTWDTLVPDQLRHCQVELIVPVAFPEPEKAMPLFQWLRDSTLGVPILGVLPSEPETELLNLISATAEDFVLWPVRQSELRERCVRIMSVQRTIDDEVRLRLAGETGLADLIGNDEQFAMILAQLPRIAASGASVLITGETGTGKELCARAIHSLSSRAAGPFVPVDCGAMPEHLIENELFGHARGAFTDAHQDQKGLAALAEHGTLFLDEVDALSLTSQAKLLRLLQEGTYRALGAERFARADVRIVAATNQDLEAHVREKRFRSDLYFRLNVLAVRMPALRDRRSDIPLLARHFLRSSTPNGSTRKMLGPAAERKLESYHWPGNVRELFNAIQRAAILAPGQQIQPSHVSIPGFTSGQQPPLGFREARTRAVAEFERGYLTEILRKYGGNITHAACEAGKDRRTFGRLIKKYGINPHTC
jgi:two-component system response regulator GlrR